MSEKITTTTPKETLSPAETLSAADFKDLLTHEYGLDGETPQARTEQFKQLPADEVARMIDDINTLTRGLTEPSHKEDGPMKIGEQVTIAPEHRYDVFMSLMQDIKDAPGDVNPARIGDTLALGIVLLHPFHDGNGRTARLVGQVFHEEYDEDYKNSYAILAQSRDEIRKRGGWQVNGYIPHFENGEDQSDPVVVTEYLHQLLASEDAPYTGPFGPAPLHDPELIT